MKKINKVLCAIDFSQTSSEALEYALEMAESKKAELYLLHVFHIDMLSATVYTEDQAYQEAEARLISLCKKHEPLDGYIHPIIRVGSVAETVVQCIEALKADFVVMGSRGHSGFKKLLLGSTAEYVLEHSSVPVLIIRPGLRAN